VRGLLNTDMQLFGQEVKRHRKPHKKIRHYRARFDAHSPPISGRDFCTVLHVN
jgi:hypothetical protein